jgi:hypothetical protein
MTKTWVATTAKWIAASRPRETAREDRLFSDPLAMIRSNYLQAAGGKQRKSYTRGNRK